MEKRRIKCSFIGCDRKAKFTWNACADGNADRGVCAEHDALINLLFMERTRPRNWKNKLKTYIETL